MILGGNYPFYLNVANTFPVDKNPQVTIHVEFHDYPAGTPAFNEAGLREMKTNEFDIPNGGQVSFPMFSGESYVNITIIPDEDFPISDTQYYVYGGSKCRYEATNLNPESKIPSTYGDRSSGIWVCNSQDGSDWQLKVSKLRPDPEDENVTVGPDIP